MAGHVLDSAGSNAGERVICSVHVEIYLVRVCSLISDRLVAGVLDARRAQKTDNLLWTCVEDVLRGGG